MIDRNARNQMTEAIRSYMDEGITAFQFDDALTQTSRTTSDETVQTIRKVLWYHYDDCKDHKIVASKQQWDFFNRLLLLLESEGELETGKSWYEWHPLQCVAAFLLLLYIITTYREGLGGHLIGFALPYGPPSMLLAWFNHRRERKNITTAEISLIPFPTFGSLMAVRRRAAGFRKRAYPHAVAGRRIRDGVIEKLMWIQWLFIWCMFAPVALFFQMLPRRRCETSITIPLPNTSGS